MYDDPSTVVISSWDFCLVTVAVTKPPILCCTPIIFDNIRQMLRFMDVALCFVQNYTDQMLPSPISI